MTTTDVEATWRDAPMVRTLLDMISSLDHAGTSIVTVVLDGEFARDYAVAAFLREAYPAVDIVVSATGSSR